MDWDVEYTDEFLGWWEGLREHEQEDVGAVIDQLAIRGPALPYPYASAIRGTRQLSRLYELRIQHAGQPYRVLYAFDPRRTAILLLGGSKVGNERWYEVSIPRAERLYAAHIAQLEAEGLI